MTENLIAHMREESQKYLQDSQGLKEDHFRGEPLPNLSGDLKEVLPETFRDIAMRLNYFASLLEGIPSIDHHAEGARAYEDFFNNPVELGSPIEYVEGDGGFESHTILVGTPSLSEDEPNK
jgi:hypothetical protein